MALSHRLIRRPLTGHQEFMDTLSLFFYFASAGKFIGSEFRRGHRPKIAAFIPKRVLQQQRISVENLFLNFFQLKGSGCVSAA